ncbi:SDR family NAD(P)-dependent oxidoreductase [Marmoricola endophyticus]|uniref:SDR family NAD(P)-dependent oxidoreductase n=1 Tax=Marmoricola endophyticus TaxID=2040280 RepID=UPI001E395059|nr:SDR family NAD(P)-dependent oxidoreductase [Marmoricola endophyticus]
MLGTLLLTPTAVVRRAVGAVLPLPSPLRDRVVLVTGASSGIGAATARQVAARGATVLLVARREDRLTAVADEIRAAGGDASSYVCDLTDTAAIDGLVARVLDEHGRVDYLVNNAGRSIRRSLELSYDRFHDVERTMAVNYFGPVRLILALMPQMREQRFGHVVNVLTWGVQIKAPKFSAYIASKTALDVFSRIAGREAFGDNVTFSSVRISLVRTDMVVATEAYRRTPALTPDQAAAKVVRALEDRPLTVDTLAGSLAEVANLVAPRLSDAVMWAANAAFPDSRAARGLPPRREVGETGS